MSPAGEAYVIEVAADRVRILDRRRQRLFEPMSTGEVLARGGWIEFTGDDSVVLAEAQRIDDQQASG